MHSLHSGCTPASPRCPVVSCCATSGPALGGERLHLRERFFGVNREVARRVDDVPDGSLRVDHIGHAGGDAALLIEDAPDLPRLAVREIAEQGEAEAEFTRVGAGREGGIDAEAQDLGAGRFELAIEFLEAGQFVRSTAGEREHIPGHDHSLPAVVAERVLAAVAVHQGEIRGLLSNLDWHLGSCRESREVHLTPVQMQFQPPMRIGPPLRNRPPTLGPPP